MHKVFFVLLYVVTVLILTFESEVSCSFFHHKHKHDHKHKDKHHGKKVETPEEEKSKRRNLENLEELKNMPRHNITPYLLEKEGYPCETHTVMTEDGYYVTMHRIPHGKPGNGSEISTNLTTSFSGNDTNMKKPAVLLLHGFMACDECWLVNAPDKNLPFILANKGYDVWLGNLRGCYYSKNHTKIPINSTAFWNFGFHEQGKYDLPAMTDYILNVTGQKKVNLIGHSMGTTVIYVMLSVRPEYNDKINMSICLAPVAYMSHVTSPTVRVSAYVFHLLRNSFFGDFLFKWNLPFWPRNVYTEDQIQNLICKDDRAKKWCMASFFMFMGFDYCQMSVDNFNLFTTIYPAGTSASAGLHFEQLVYSKQFQQYDFGPDQNLVRYGSLTPPKYNLSNVRAPMTLFFGDNDWLANPRDIATLISEVHPDSVKENCRVRFRRFNHLDFLVARDVNILLYDRILQVLEGKSCRNGDDKSDAIDEDIKCNFTEDHDFMIPEEHKEQFQHVTKALQDWLDKSQFLPK